MIAFTIPGEPVAFARAGANGGQRFTPKRQRDFMALVRLAASQAMDGQEPFADPIPIQFDLAELADEILSLGDEEIDKDYRHAVSWHATQPGDCIVFLDDVGIAAHHAGALKWARDLLDRTQADFGVRLLGRGANE